MLKVEEAINLNKYGQDILHIKYLLKSFSELKTSEKRNYLTEVLSLIHQSKPKEEDIELSIISSGLKPTYTPCVLLKKGFGSHNLNKIINLPDNELNKSLILFLNLFKIVYKRRFLIEKDNPDKWWYWDLSEENNINKIPEIFN